MRSLIHLIMLLLLCGSTFAQTSTANNDREIGTPYKARLTQGQFSSSTDQFALQHALSAAVGTAIRIDNPGADPSNGDGAASDAFGCRIAVQGDTALVGACFDDLGARELAGSVYVFTRTGSAWLQQTKLTASDGEGGDSFGSSLAFLGDTALIGAPSDDVGAITDQGSVYVFARSGSNWTEQTKLTAANGTGVGQFGASIAISGDTVVIGSTFDNVGGFSSRGSAFVFTRNGASWSQQARLVAADGRGGDRLGTSVAISGDTILAGVPAKNLGATSTQEGATYVFTRSGVSWSEQAKLIANDAAIGDLFGFGVALLGDTAIISATGDDVAFANSGSAYIFTRSGTVWTQQSKLTVADGVDFGGSIALTADTLLISANSLNITPNGAFQGPGAVYVYAGSGANWTQQARLQASDGENFDRFGVTAISGDTVVLGAPGDRIQSNGNQGSAYVFTRSGSTWSQQAQLNSGLGASDEAFGYAVALSGDTALVGVSLDDVGTKLDQGSSYVFTRVGSSWIQQAQLIAADGATDDRFGFAVALSGDTAVIGAHLDDVNGVIDQGSAYVFTRVGNVWTQQAKLTSDDSDNLELLGFSVAISGDTALIGARGDTVAGINQGTAYVFTRSNTNWSLQTKLIAANGMRLDFFGISVALAGNTALIGASGAGTASNLSQGSAYVFVRSGASWSQQVQLFASDGAAFDAFGTAVALSGDSAIIGAISDDVGTNADQGSAYVFTRQGSAWSQQVKLVASDGSANDRFGSAVAISGDTAIVGAPLDTIGVNARQGSAQLYTRANGAWNVGSRILAGDAQAQHEFGVAVAASGRDVMVGAHRFDSLGATGNPNVGAVYVFETEPSFRNGFEE
jgi:FG-GAP repeat